MRDFEKIEWKKYNRPPFYQQWLCRDDTIKLASFGDKGLAEVDDQVLALKDQWDLENVEGHFLDRLGKILAEPRNGNDDELYRLFLRLRTMLNTTNGTVNDVIKAIKFLYSGEVVHIVPDFPAGLIILHDGEGPPIDFNRIIKEVIAAGVAYDTRELFYISDTIGQRDGCLGITVNAEITDVLMHSLKYNGAIKYDGHTANDYVYIRARYDGRFKYNGAIKYNGVGKIAAAYKPRPPFKYGYRGFKDIITLTASLIPFADSQKLADGPLTMGFSSSHNERIGVSDAQAAAVRINAGADELGGLRDETAARLLAGEFKDPVALDDASSTGMRYHHYYDGTYKYDGSIKYNSGVLIPLE
jgi:hypothetical protein